MISYETSSIVVLTQHHHIDQYLPARFHPPLWQPFMQLASRDKVLLTGIGLYSSIELTQLYYLFHKFLLFQSLLLFKFLFFNVYVEILHARFLHM